MQSAEFMVRALKLFFTCGLVIYLKVSLLKVSTHVFIKYRTYLEPDLY